MANSSRPSIRRFVVVLFLLALAVLCSARSAHAFAHVWQVKEAFSNADGSVQFIEMFDSFSSENFVSGWTLQSNSDGVIKSFTFPADLAGNTANKHLLITTSGFGALPGAVAPDFTFDQGGVTGSFFNPNATSITISFSASSDSITFTGASLPKNGINSLTDATVNLPPTLVSGVNSPTNYNNLSGSVNLSAPSPTGDYNGNHVVDAADYVVWRHTKNQSASPNGSGADGNSNGTIDDGDYTFWRSKFGNAAGGGVGQGSAVPEPAAAGAVFLLTAFVLSRLRKRRL